jgi:isopenicillin N synthase-like dioxygenase
LFIQFYHSSKMSFTTVPVLDLAAAKDPATKPQLLEQLRHALMEVGFLYIRNTDIPNELLDQVKAAGKAVFDIPEEEK